MPGRSSPFTIGQGAQRIIQGSLGWPAGAIAGDNPTPGYLHFPGMPPGLQWVFPFTYGFCYPILPPSLAPFTVTTKDVPPGFPPAPAYTGVASLALYEDPLPYSIGRTSIYAPQTKLSTLNFLTGTSTITTDAVPVGTHSLRLATNAAVGGTTVIILSVKGHQSGETYFPFGNFTGLPAMAASAPLSVMVPIDSTQDSTFDINATVSANIGVTVTAILDTQVIYVAGQAAAPLPAVLVSTNPLSNVILGDVTNPTQAQPLGTALWDYDSSGSNAPAGGSQASIVLAATPGKTYHCSSIQAFLTAAGTAGAPEAELLDGAAVLAFAPLAVVATADTMAPPWVATPVAYKGTAGNSMTLKFLAGLTSALEAVNIGAYLR